MGFQVKRDGQAVGRNEQQKMYAMAMRQVKQNPEDKQSAINNLMSFAQTASFENPTGCAGEMTPGQRELFNMYGKEENITGMPTFASANNVNLPTEIEAILNRSKQKMASSEQPIAVPPQFSQAADSKESIKQQKANLIMKKAAIEKKASWSKDENLKVTLADLNRQIRKLDEKLK